MRKWMTCLAVALALLALPAGLAEGYWDASREIRCREHRQNCRLLQMIMMGSFADYDPDDVVSGRILSSAFPQLCQITEDDIAHFLSEFSEDQAAVRVLYYDALANCLWADILSDSASMGKLSAAQRVLLLFLSPESQSDAEAQMAAIRSGMTDEVLARIADMAGVPTDFAAWLIGTDEASG